MTPIERINTEWIEVNNDLPDGPGAVVKVKTENGKELKAYYHRDKMIQMSFYFGRDHILSHWQCYETRKWLYDVTHWRKLKYDMDDS